MTAESGGSEWLSAISSCAQVIVGMVALWVAYQANRMSQNSAYRERITVELFDIMLVARVVRQHYLNLFESSVSITSKTQRRTRWLQAREDLSDRLQALFDVDAPVTSLIEAWERVEDEEAPHVLNDELICAEAERQRARRSYDTCYGVFKATLGPTLKRVQRHR